MAQMPLLGDVFPELKVHTTHGPMQLPQDLKGHWFVLFSHPGDFTPVCTTEFAAFQDKALEFEKLNTKLVGLSIDQVFSHIKWTEWIQEHLGRKITFPVIADGSGMAAEKLGMLHPEKGGNTVRAVFIVDPEGVLKLMLYYPQEIGRNIDEILRSIKALQTHSKHSVALPADWPDNALIGDKVIIPPASDEESAQSRPSQYNCYDWWFCYKEL